jgi:hypothetical protein
MSDAKTKTGMQNIYPRKITPFTDTCASRIEKDSYTEYNNQAGAIIAYALNGRSMAVTHSWLFDGKRRITLGLA